MITSCLLFAITTPQSVAMRVSGHATTSTFLRYDITSEEDKRAALERTHAHRQAQPATAPKVAQHTGSK